jgi:hypothetical protein
MNRLGCVVLFSLLCCGFILVPAGADAATIEAQYAIARTHSAKLEADINPLGEPTSCQAQYVAEDEFQASGYGTAKTVQCEPEDLGSGVGVVTATAALSGLAIDTTYHYRFLAGGATGADKTFSTFGFEDFTFKVLDQSGEPESRARSHPYKLLVTANFSITDDRGMPSPAGILKDLFNELPPGMVGSATAVPPCPSRISEEQRCSGDSQVGRLWVSHGLTIDEGPAPLFNVDPPRGKAARFAASINLSTGAFIDASVRSDGNYGLTAGSHNITSLANPYGVKVEMWGVPSNSGHDADRSCPAPITGYEVGCASDAPKKPFLTLPSQCDGPLVVRALADAYGSPGEWVAATAGLPPVIGCDQLEFTPSLEARPTNQTADSPTGFHVDLHVPQHEDPEELATPDLKDAVVKLPPGLTLNPSSAGGLVGCTPAQLGLTTPVGSTPIHTTATPAACPEAAKIGTVEVETPLLDHALPGAVYVATPYENPFGSLLAIYIAVDDPESGVVIKLAGRVEIGPEGQLTTTFEENPQLPFEDFKLDFFGGNRAVLKTPAVCGTYATTSTLTPWSAPESGPPATPSDTHQIGNAPGGGNCPTSADQLPNKPGFEAGTESPLAGAFSPFVLHLKRDDGTQQFSSLTVTPPPGLLGKLAGIPYCPDSVLAAAAGKTGVEERGVPSCPAASEVGLVNVGAGAGPSPYHVQGHAYLAGPYKGAPLSLAIVTPAVAGPYDLGTVVVRSALEVDPFTAQITVKSDPIPTELKGIPLDIRSVAVKMDRSDFTLNPTNCETMNVAGSLTTALGQTAALANRFQVGGCDKLGFRPKLKIQLKGGTKRNRFPALKAVLTYPRKGTNANIARAQVGLPTSEFLEQGHIGTVCTRPQLAAAQCPPASIYGRAKAWSPLLDKPLAGPVYLGTGFGHALPDLVADLNGQIRVLLHARIDTTKQKGLRSSFEVVPDAPVSRFVLEMKGGKKGLLVNSENLCRKTRRANARFVAQNGRQVTLRPVVQNSCKKAPGGKRGSRR